ncbi:PhzF family phenazine biosynthesis protein [Novosphingobium sp.]|uniref:PhzF family phenazine biosynthesis protein n=1 Tax=Novosphingobium sp. TaxID=1874826 RepID=UPI00356AC850
MTDSKVPYFHVDAFTATPLKGNQAAVMMLEAWPDDATLQAIGAENMFAETAFLVPDHSGAADFELRWFTPAAEVAMCGHATLASGHVVLAQDPMRGRVTFATRQVGILEVARAGDVHDGDVYALSLPAMETALAAFDEALPLLGAAVPQEVWRGGEYNIFLYASVAEVMALTPHFKALAAYGDVQFIATANGAGHASGADVVSRVFVPGVGIDEDAATGSAHAALTPFWTKRLGRNSFSAHQASARGADFACRLEGDRAMLGGSCVTVVEGLFRLP